MLSLTKAENGEIPQIIIIPTHACRLKPGFTDKGLIKSMHSVWESKKTDGKKKKEERDGVAT